MSDGRWIKAHRPSDGLRYHNDAVEYGRMMRDHWRDAEGQRVESIRWCETHRAEAVDGYGICPEQPMDEEHPCVVILATLILPPKEQTSSHD